MYYTWWFTLILFPCAFFVPQAILFSFRCDFGSIQIIVAFHEVLLYTRGSKAAIVMLLRIQVILHYHHTSVATFARIIRGTGNMSCQMRFAPKYTEQDL